MSRQNPADFVPPPGSGTPPPPVASARLDMKYLIRALIKYNASDLHLKVGRPPLYRINGSLIPLKMPELTPEQLDAILLPLLTPKQREDLENRRQVNLSFALESMGRFRCNMYFQLGNLSAAIRTIPLVVPSLDSIGVPPVLKDFCHRPRGLFLVTGATGTGKSTTLAGMIQYINENSHVHILSIADPIEFVFRDQKACITQREVGSDLLSMADGIQAGLRQDPDVIVIGELLDRQMIQTALTAAETGHLVLSTLHTNNARSTLNRILDVFPAESRAQVRVQLASTLIGVVSQQLLMRSDGSGRVPACEVLVKSPTIEELIRKGELDAIQDVMAGSNDHYRMQTMNQALKRLVTGGIITLSEAVKSSDAPDDLKLALSGVDRENGYEMAVVAEEQPKFDKTG